MLLRDVITPLGLRDDQVNVPVEPLEYEALIAAAGGVDVQLLGIGRNGHLGFNEPGARLDGRTHVADLAPETREDNARFFSYPDDVPRRCVTQGLGTILRAGRLVLLAFGPRKADAVAAALEGPVTTSTPASVLQTHCNVTVMLDRAAASRLRDSTLAS